MENYEIIIKDRWVIYPEEMNVVTDHHFGFRGGRYCVANLESFYNRKIDVLEEKDSWVDCIYLDLIKSFNKVYTSDYYRKWKTWEDRRITS